MIRKILYLLAGLSLSTGLQAASITVNDLPGEIQTCHNAGTCTVNLNSVMDVWNTTGSTNHENVLNPFAMNAFLMGDNEFLLRYNLVKPSARVNEGGAQHLTGSVWMRVGTEYDTLAATPRMTLYFEDVNLTYYFDHLDADLTAGALLAGSGYERIGCCEEPSVSGDMWVSSEGYGLGFCLADGCYSDARLNLLYLVYTDPDGDGVLQLGFNPADTRGLLFRTGGCDPYGGPLGDGSCSSTSFFVSAVPLPSAFWLLGSGLLLLVRAGSRIR